MGLVRIEAPHFVAGVVLDKWDVVVRAPPILAWAMGKQLIDLRAYCKRKGWKLVLSRENP